MVKVSIFNEIIDALVTLFADNSQAACTCSISAHVPPNCTGVWLHITRGVGTGTLDLYPDSGGTAVNVGASPAPACTAALFLPISGQAIKYKCSAAETWTIKMLGYVIEGERKTA